MTNKWRYWSVFLLLLVSIAGFVIRCKLVSGSLPYCRHIDESMWSHRALNMLKTGDFNPHRFNKPTLPTYLMASGFAVGYLHACSRLELKHVRDIGSNAYPFYRHKTVVFPARVLYAGLSVLTLVFIGIVGYRAFRIHSILFLAPLVLSVSSLYLHLSWSYLNVDIVGCFFAVSLLFFLCESFDTKHTTVLAVVSGLLCGLTVGSKYNLFPIIVPCLLFFLLYHRERWIRLSLLAVGTAVVSFVVTTPYALLDLPTFLEHVGYEVRHYKQGHEGFDGEPGLAQFLYYVKALRVDFGWFLTSLAVAGLLYMHRLDWRKSAVLVSFPVCFLLYMSAQRVHFVRNIVGLLIRP